MDDHQVHITMEADDVNRRMERLKATQFFSDEEPPSQLKSWQQDLFWKKNYMDSELQEAVRKGNADEFVKVLEKVCLERKLRSSIIFDQVTRGGESLLHVAASFGKTDIAKLIGHHFPALLTKTNIMGDTPLHVAARNKSADVIKVILSEYNAHRSSSSTDNKEDEKIITKLANKYGNTALHDVVESKHIEGVHPIYEADKSMAHCLNKSSISPLYLAVLNESMEIVNIMLEAPFPDGKLLPEYHGNSPLHAAIHTKNAALLKHLMEQRKELIYLRDEEGGTPLHYAATIGFVKGVHELLDMPTPTALEWNSKGHLPIHLACKWGHVEALKKLLKHKKGPPYPGALLNQKGQNILHIAAKNGRDNVVDYLKSKDIDINARDNDGNTPLHLAAKYNFPSIIKSLTQNKRILVNILSKEGTARDTLWKHSEVPMTIRQWLSDAILDAAGAKCSFETRNDNNRKRGMGAKQDVIKQNSNTLMLVAVLIVTVAFQAAVTAPTYNKNDIVTSVLGIFVLFNSMAMYFSTFGSLLLIWAQFGGGQRFYDTALYTVLVALLCMTFAFIAATGVALDIYTEPGLYWTLLGIAIFVGLIFYVLIFHFCHLSFLVFKTHKSAPIPLRVAKPSIFMNILIWFYKNSPKEKDYKKLQNSANSQQVDMANQNENQ